MLVVIDTETTGLAHAANPPRKDGIVQVGIAWREGSAIRTWESLCNPGAEYFEGGRADEALRVNGIKVTDVLAAPSAREVGGQLRELLEHMFAGLPVKVPPLAAYNVAFDRPLLEAEPWNVIGFDGTVFEEPLWAPCLMLEAMEVITARTTNGRLPLSMACRAAGLRPAEAHSAACDARDALLLHEWVVRKKEQLAAPAP